MLGGGTGEGVLARRWERAPSGRGRSLPTRLAALLGAVRVTTITVSDGYRDTRAAEGGHGPALSAALSHLCTAVFWLFLSEERWAQVLCVTGAVHRIGI